MKSTVIFIRDVSVIYSSEIMPTRQSMRDLSEMRGVVDRATFEKMVKLLNKTDFRDVVFPNGSNCKIKAKKYINCRRDFSEMMSQVMCLPIGELVMTENGLKPIETIQIGSKVLTHKGRFRRVTNTFNREYDGDMIEVKTNGSPIPLRLTPEHPALAVNILRPVIHQNSEMEILQSQWLEAKTLTKEIMLQYPILTEDEDITHINWCATPKIRGWNLKPINFDVDEDFLTLCGYYVAEGAVIKNNGQTRVILTFGKNLKEFFLAIDAVARVVKMGLAAWVSPSVNGYSVHITSRSLGEYLQNNFGTGSYNKRIPTWLMKLPENKVNWFFNAYIEGDGTRWKDNLEYGIHHSISASTVSPQLAVGLKNLGIKLHYRSCVRRYNYNNGNNIILGRKVNTMPIYRISFNELGRRKDSRVYLDDKYIYLKIKDIKTTHYKGMVWNLAVEEDESYCTSYYTVHNCRTWYSPALYSDKDLMVDVFRKNIKKAWNEYNATCGRRRGDKLNPQTWRRL